jgi:hypothetical protein
MIVAEEPGVHKSTKSADPGGGASDLDRGETLHSLLMSTVETPRPVDGK